MISSDIPRDFTPRLEVASCYIEHAGHLLFLQRHPEHKHSSRWGLPAGKMEQGESAEQAIVREVAEETGLTIDSNGLVYREVLFVSHEGKEFLYHVFHMRFTEKPAIVINPPEHKGYGWFTPQEAMKMNLIHDQGTCIERHYGGSFIV